MLSYCYHIGIDCLKCFELPRVPGLQKLHKKDKIDAFKFCLHIGNLLQNFRRWRMRSWWWWTWWPVWTRSPVNERGSSSLSTVSTVVNSQRSGRHLVGFICAVFASIEHNLTKSWRYCTKAKLNSWKFDKNYITSKELPKLQVSKS